MHHKLTLPQLKKYDITQKVIEALADAESRAIIFTTINKGKAAYDLAETLKIPLSLVAVIEIGIQFGNMCSMQMNL